MRAYRLFLLVTGLMAAGVAQAQVAPPPQSPINFVPADLVPMLLPGITFDYKTYANDVVAQRIPVKNEGSSHRQLSLKAKFDDLTLKSTVTVEGTTYTLSNIHFHQHSEHFQDGDPFLMEMHMVHKSAAGANLAIGRWIEVGADNNAVLAEMFHMDNWPQSGQTRPLQMPFNLGGLIPAAPMRSYRYDGSLTTPDAVPPPADPFPNDLAAFTSTAKVKWIMFTEPMQMSQLQIDLFAGFTVGAANGWPNGNARPIQLLTDDHRATLKYGDAVPEPSTVWLLAVAGLVAGRHRRR